MDYRDLITRLRSVTSRSKGELLERAAQAIERLTHELDMCRAERDALYKLARGETKEDKT